MTNNIKLTVLFVLMAVLLFLGYSLHKEHKLLEYFEKQNQKEDFIPMIKEEFPEPTIPTLTMNATINSSLDKFIYKDKIINSAVKVSELAVVSTVESGILLSDATISDIKFVDTGTAGLYDNVEMFNIELLYTTVDGEKINNNSDYMVFYSRWDEDGEGTYFVTSLTEEFIQSEYSTLLDDFNDDIYAVACMKQRESFLLSSHQYSREELYDASCKKAVAYSLTVDDLEISADNFTVDASGDTTVYTYSTNNENVFVNVAYMRAKETDKWVFLYAFS